MWCLGRTEKISWTDPVRNEEVLHRVKEEREYPTYGKKVWLTGFVTCGVGTAF
jgi:hypothetical protein